jgi:hypothetical protein
MLVLAAYGVGGPVMGALAVAIVYLAGLGALHLAEVATQGLFVALI